MFGLGVFAKAYRLSTGSRASWGTINSNGFYSGAAPSNLSEIVNINGDVQLQIPDTKVEITVRRRRVEGIRLRSG